MDEYRDEYEAFKGGRGGRSKSNTGAALGTSILANSGVVAHAGGITQCSSTDTTWFCWLSRLVGMLQYVLYIFFVLLLVYYFVFPFISKKLGFSGSKKGGRYR
jgi:hypothetical protein